MTGDVKKSSRFEEGSGLSADELFERGMGISYQDFTVIDTNFSDVDKDCISLATNLGNGISIKTPLMASPMDTVTNADLAIAIALEGGIACLHYNHKGPDGSIDVAAQIAEIRKVKAYENGFIETPITASPNETIEQILQKADASGRKVDTFPVTSDAGSHSKLVGLLRKQDYSRSRHPSAEVCERMVPLEKLRIARFPITLEEANDALWDLHVSYLPIVDGDGNLKYLVTRSDLDKNEMYPLATKDENKRLRVLFAVDTKPGATLERLERGFDAGADGCIIDSSQGNTKFEKDMVEFIRRNYPDKLLIGGNVSTMEGYRVLDDAGVHAARIGQGSGSICTTAGAIGVSRSGATGVYESSLFKHLEDRAMVTIADGGLRMSGDVFKALLLGAGLGMAGNMLAGTKESPGEIITDPESGRPVKVYRGMGSKEANVGGIRGYDRLPQGVSGKVDYIGSIHDFVPLIRDGLCSSLHAVNCLSIPELHEKMHAGDIRFERRSMGSMAESGVHNLK
jgi:IMP dehydrogenase